MPFTSSLRLFSIHKSLQVFSLQNPFSFLSLHKRIFANKKQFDFSLSVAATAMDCSSSCMLVLCGKSSVETELAQSLKNNNTLKLPDDGKVSIFLHSEIEKQFEDGSFNVESFMNSLSTARFGRFLIWSPRLSSTHDVVSHNSELPVGSVCVADVQSSGRGRSKNVWQSPAGCLMFSFTVQLDDARIGVLLQYVVSIAITEAIKDVCDAHGLPLLNVKIKWPNDLFLNGLKVGGVLCTSTYRSKKLNVRAGIGLNVDNDKPTTCLNAALRELSSGAYQFSREEIIAAFFNKFEIFFELFINQGFQTLEELYYKTWLHRKAWQTKDLQQAIRSWHQRRAEQQVVWFEPLFFDLTKDDPPLSSNEERMHEPELADQGGREDDEVSLQESEQIGVVDVGNQPTGDKYPDRGTYRAPRAPYQEVVSDGEEDDLYWEILAKMEQLKKRDCQKFDRKSWRLEYEILKKQQENEATKLDWEVVKA